MYSWVNSWICSIQDLPSAAGSLESSSSSEISSISSCLPELDNLDLFWDFDLEPDLSTLEELVQNLSSLSEQAITENTAITPNEMVGQTSTKLEPSIADVPFTDHDNLIKPTEPQSSTIIQDAWKMTSVTGETQSSILIPTLEIKEEQPEFVIEDMISEEIVITSEDLFLNEASCDEKITTGSICSDGDIDDRSSDQGYESIDSPFSDVDHSLPELFPELM